MRFSPGPILRVVCALAALCLASCKTGDYHYGRAAFTLPTSFSRIHSPGALTVISGSRTSPEMFMVIRATHNEDPFKLSDADWYRSGDAALKEMGANRSFANAREISRASGYQSGFRTMDHVLAGAMTGFGFVSSDVVISSRLFHSRDEAYFFALAQGGTARSADPERFSRIMSTIRFEP